MILKCGENKNLLWTRIMLKKSTIGKKYNKCSSRSITHALATRSRQYIRSTYGVPLPVIMVSVYIFLLDVIIPKSNQ